MGGAGDAGDAGDVGGLSGVGGRRPPIPTELGPWRTARARLLLLRTALGTLAVSSAFTGVPALLAPRWFFDGFPGPVSLVELLPPYNAHLVTDAGGFYLAFALLFAWAALRPHPALVAPLGAAWTLAATAHLIFHLTHLDGFPLLEAVTQTIALATVLVLPLLVVVLRDAGAAAPPAPRGHRNDETPVGDRGS